MIARAGGIDEGCHAGRLDLVKLGLLRRAEARACSARGIGMAQTDVVAMGARRCRCPRVAAGRARRGAGTVDCASFRKPCRDETRVAKRARTFFTMRDEEEPCVLDQGQKACVLDHGRPECSEGG